MDATEILDHFEFEDHLFLEEGDDKEVVAKYYSPLEGEVAAARLRSEGIPCFLANATAQTLLPHLQIIARLHVRPSDVKHARDILGEAAIDDPESPRSSPINWWLVTGTILAVLIGLVLAKIFIRGVVH